MGDIYLSICSKFRCPKDIKPFRSCIVKHLKVSNIMNDKQQLKDSSLNWCKPVLLKACGKFGGRVTRIPLIGHRQALKTGPVHNSQSKNRWNFNTSIS